MSFGTNDRRSNRHFTLKENPLQRSDLDDFVAYYNPKNRHERRESERFKSYTYEELIKCDSSTSTSCARTNPLLPMQRIFLQAGWLPCFASACRAFYEARALPWRRYPCL